jgi:hypothetical protein
LVCIMSGRVEEVIAHLNAFDEAARISPNDG